MGWETRNNHPYTHTLLYRGVERCFWRGGELQVILQRASALISQNLGGGAQVVHHNLTKMRLLKWLSLHELRRNPIKNFRSTVWSVTKDLPP